MKYNEGLTKVVPISCDTCKDYKVTKKGEMADEHVYDFSGTINVPFWHQNLVLAILSSLGILGIFLNGFVICCFILQPMVSKDLFRNTDLL